MAESSGGAINKAVIRKQLREKLSAMTDQERHAKSVAAGALVTSSREFDAAQVVMLYLSMAHEVDTAPIALRCWQAGKTVVVPKVSWDQRRMLPTEITSLTAGLTVTGAGVREPVGGMPIPAGMIDLVIVPGMGFTEGGHRIGRGMGFYDRFLGQEEFIGLSCGLGFEEQIVAELPMLEHDMVLEHVGDGSGDSAVCDELHSKIEVRREKGKLGEGICANRGGSFSVVEGHGGSCT